MRDFTPPPVTTKGNVGRVALAYAFQLTAKFDPAKIEKTPRGGRVFHGVASGTISGPGLRGEVYPDSGGDYGLIRAKDHVEDLSARFMVKADNGEWLYFSHVGYRRPDGYFRIQAYLDADAGGPYAWLNDAVMIGTAEASPDGRDVTFTYYQAL
jgi:hypothetical protein